MTPVATHPDPLVWGHGPKVLEAFVEPTCPFSARAFGKFDALLAAAGEERLTLKIRLLSQPWHVFSPLVTRAILATSSVSEGKSSAWQVMKAVSITAKNSYWRTTPVVPIWRSRPEVCSTASKP